MRKTRLMRQVEEDQKGKLEVFLPVMVEELGFAGTADKLGLSTGTVKYWLGLCGYRSERRVVPVGVGESDGNG